MKRRRASRAPCRARTRLEPHALPSPSSNPFPSLPASPHLLSSRLAPSFGQERCSAALEKARRNQARQGKLPPGVWWGFHLFWPPEQLKNKEGKGPLDDPDFLRKVFALMNDPKVVDTFSIFDKDGSGAIDAKELEGLVQMLAPNPAPTIVKEMMRELDMDSDGEIDLWEFCVHMQKRTEGLTKADLQAEIEFAFGLFEPDKTGCIDEAELRRVLQNPHTGAALAEEELQALIQDLDKLGCGFSANGGRVSLHVLRQHPCFQTSGDPQEFGGREPVPPQMRFP